MLAAWDAKAGVGSVGEALWREFLVKLELTSNGFSPPPYVHPVDAAHPLTTPNTIDTANPRVITALGAAVQQLAASGVSLDAPWGSVHSTPSAGGGEIPLPGCSNAEGCLNITDNSYSDVVEPAGGRFPEVNVGSSCLMSTYFTISGPQTNELLAYSQSDNPASPHFDDQTRLFSKGTLVRQRFTLADIGGDPALQLTLLVILEVNGARR